MSDHDLFILSRAQIIDLIHECGGPEADGPDLINFIINDKYKPVRSKGHQLHALVLEEKVSDQQYSNITHTRLYIRKNGETTTVEIPIGEIDEWIQKHIQEPDRGRIVKTEPVKETQAWIEKVWGTAMNDTDLFIVSAQTIRKLAGAWDNRDTEQFYHALDECKQELLPENSLAVLYRGSGGEIFMRSIKKDE
jgi:hypothetical protein